jgi:crotonobetainyl-CoA:carnitine CoA-transferase CaiB-like acyl-CoA transferase
VIERQIVIQLDHAHLGPVPGVRSPPRYQNPTLHEGRAQPALGDSAEGVLREIGLGESEIQALFDDGVIA